MTIDSDSGIERIISETYGFDLEADIQRHMRKGNLPGDTFLRMSVIGAQVVDLAAEGLQRVNIMEEVLAHAEAGAPLSADTHELIHGHPPSVLLNFPGLNREELNEITQHYDDPHYSKADLVLAIKERRRSEGKTITNDWVDRTRTPKRHWNENSVANGLAHSVWRVLLTRARPGWLTEEGLQGFWVPKVSKTQKGTRLKVELDADYQHMRRVLVSAALFSDSAVLELYKEVRSVGIKGLGEVGTCDIALMLSDQHPELHPDI